MFSPDPTLLFFRFPRSADRQSIEDFALELRDGVAPGHSFSCLITSDAEVRTLNEQYRRKNRATDVLSFPVDPDAPGQSAYLGDIAISWQRARDQAHEFGHSIETEIKVLMLHGLLHLLGMDHETDRGKMFRTEARWRRTFGLPAGLIERVHA